MPRFLLSSCVSVAQELLSAETSVFSLPFILYEFIILDLTSSVNQKFRPDNPERKNLYSICYPNPSIFPVLHSIQILTGFQLLLAVFFIPHLVYLATLSSVSVSSTQGMPSLSASENGCSSILFIYPFPWYSRITTTIDTAT